MKSFLFSSLAAAAAAAAQQSAYGQCGGSSWTGETTCASGYTCHSYNDYYAQCVPGTASASAAASSILAASSSAAATPTTLQTVVASAVSSVEAVAVSSSAVVVSSAAAATASAASTSNSSTAFAKTDGTKFNIDGVTKYYAGTNSYWIGFLTSDSDVDTIMSHISTSGLKILRVWGFNDVTALPTSGTVYFQYFNNGEATINTGADGLERLDAVVKSAEKYGIKLIINFVNNWTDYGGMAAYFTACGATSNAEWYTTAKCQTFYQTYIKAVVSRYSSSSAVFAWELANEPRCNGCNTTVLTSWIRTTSDYIASLDSSHMITIGDEGFGLSGDTTYPYTEGEGVDWATNLALPNISFGTFHLYPTSWGQANSFGDPWITNHAKICASVGKPCLLEEYGVTSDHCTVESDWQSTSLNASSTGMGADMFWQLGDYISSWGQESSDDGNTIYYNSTDWTCLVTNHVKAIA